ncbi:MAG: type III-A CRISPR-associated RAMP protein Csm5 [Treponema sp.]|nr:type III-A CRISPR-associated RAMP protein Csm5 [Treponema sp.]
MSKKIYKLTVKPITCVHIGTGNKLTMLDYTLRKSSSGRYLYAKFSSDRILRRISADAQKSALFEQASLSGNMKILQNFFQENCIINEDSEYFCEITKEFGELYSKNKGKDPYDNAAIVEQMYRSGSANPVIPGTSIKGAIRTAVLNELLSNISDSSYNSFQDELDNCTKDSYKAKLEAKMQKQLLGNYRDAKSDPFRAIEISDCIFPPKNTQIVGALKTLSLNKHSGELFVSNTMQIQAEAIKGSLAGNLEYGTLSFRINTDLQKEQNALSQKISKDDIIKSCNYFYLREFKSEYEKFYKEATSGCDLIQKLKEEVASCKEVPNQFIIRVGHWSQVEFVTFEENLRSPKTREIKGKKLPYGTTRTVFNNDGQYLPLGWCKCILEEI